MKRVSELKFCILFYMADMSSLPENNGLNSFLISREDKNSATPLKIGEFS